MASFIGKKEVPLDAAVSLARELLAKARAPVIAGPGADTDGMRAALLLAARAGAAVDFCRAPGSMNLVRAMIDKGLLFTTPRETRARADVLLLIGPSIARCEAIADILDGQPVLSAGDGAKRSVLWLCPARNAEELSRHDMLVADADPGAIHGIIAMLSAAIGSRPLDADGFGGLYKQDYEEIAGRLITARFGVIAFSPRDLDALAIEALFAFAEKLGASTRVTLLPLALDEGAQTAQLLTAWTTGLPPRLGFARGHPEFDPWRFDAARLSQAGECDCLLWVSPLVPKAPDWKAEIPTIAIVAPGTVFARAPDILIEAAAGGPDAGSALFNARLQALMPLRAAAAGGLPSVASVLEALIGPVEAQAA